MSNPILSICIPTYNRYVFLLSNLLSLYKQIDPNDSSIEVIVSDNGSTDLTGEIVEQFLNFPNFKYYRQPENLGFAKNYLKLVKEYAKGEYCWVIGDDDFVLQGAIPFLVNLLIERKDVDFFYPKVGFLDVQDFFHYLRPFDTSMLQGQYSGDFTYRTLGKWEELISPDYSIIFLGEVMAAIFRKSIWLTYEIPEQLLASAETVQSYYPHTVIMANTFIGRKTIYIDRHMIVAVEGNREWWAKVSYIVITHVRELVKLFRARRVSGDILKKAYWHYITISFDHAIDLLFNPKKQFRDRVSIRRYFRDILSFDTKFTIKLILLRIFRVIKNAIKKPLGKIWRLVKARKKAPVESNSDILSRNRVEFADDCKIAGKLYVENRGYIKIGSKFVANSGEHYNPIGGDTVLRFIVYTKNGKLIIGDNVGISNSTIVCWNHIEIGNNVMIGGGVKIWDTNFHSLDPKIRTSNFDYDVKTAPIKIGDYSFIGADSIILKGVTIGKNSIIAAGSVVVSDIPDNVIAGGNPCKVIKPLNPKSV